MRVIPLVDDRFGEVLLTLCVAVETSEATLVGREQHRIFSRPRHLDTIIRTRILGTPIEYEVQALMRECQGLILPIVVPLVRVAVGQHLILFDHLQHLLVEQAELSVAQESVIGQRPLTACVRVAPIVALTREVDPLGMSELVTHKAEVGITARSDGHQSNHLMESHTSFYHQILRPLIHRKVHLLIHQAEGDSLVAHYSLVVRLGVSHRLNLRQTVGHHTPHLVDIPILISLILQQFNPIVRNCHSEAEVETDTAILDCAAHSRHTAHILGNSYSLGTEVVNKFVCQREIDQSILVDTLVEELLSAVEVGISVVVIYHRGYSVEAIAIEVVLIEPILDIREEEVLHLTLAIVENLRVPILLISRITLLRVVIWRAVELVDTLVEVLNIVGVNNIHNHRNTQLVRLANERFEFLGRTEAG